MNKSLEQWSFDFMLFEGKAFYKMSPILSSLKGSCNEVFENSTLVENHERWDNLYEYTCTYLFLKDTSLKPS